MQTSEEKVKVYCKSYGVIKSNLFTNSNECLENSDIIIYQIHLPDYFGNIKDLSSFLETNELNRAKRYYKESDKNKFIICRALLKLILSFYTKLHVRNIKIDYNINKKPYLSSQPSLHFNVSHSGDYAIIAVANRIVGIDIEYINDNYNFWYAVRNTFDKDEISFIENSTYKSRTFYELWTRKEAFVKALGKGIDDDFLRVPCIDGLHIIDSLLTDTEDNWKIQSYQITKNYIFSLAFTSKKNAAEKLILYSLPHSLKDLTII